MSGFASAFMMDWRQWSLPVALLRALRASRALRMGAACRRLHANRAYRQHVAAVAPNDPWFYLSHRHYLARGLTARQRVHAALQHYEHEVRSFGPGYFEAVYQGPGLELWRAETSQGVFELRLLPGNDVLYEGGISIVARHDGQRIGVLSYSMVDAAMLQPPRKGGSAPALPHPLAIYVTRKQLIFDQYHHEAFNKAFDRCTLGHFCFAALSGVALAQGHRQVVAIAPTVHPSWTPALENVFRVAYTDFWQSLMGRESAPFGYVIDVPVQVKPLEALASKHRKRALERRAHVENVVASARDSLGAHLVAPPVQSAAPARAPATVPGPAAHAVPAAPAAAHAVPTASAGTAAAPQPARAPIASPRALVFCALMVLA